ncbi:MAG: efflux RND transporter periplasmic adaptor subunit, partial [Spirochaetes bacterium]|nr:efflux RND transporter periplasmic adaptor subunit [Spirochaetota bacterium]
MKKWKLFAGIGITAVVAFAMIALISGKKDGQAAAGESYSFSTVGRGSIESVVTSSGTLSVVSSVTVLAQMSGRLETVDVDYNDRVKAGQVLATINTDILELKAKAARAAVDKARANYELQALDLKNASSLYDKRLISEYELKTSESALEVKKAELASARASLEEIETEISQYAVITSPIDGIVLERSIDAGQSVVGGSSSASSSLFTIAEDLSRMQIEAEVDELDIGSIREGQDVRFTVEADSERTYAGTVDQIRLVPTTSGNVVYYSVIVLADNASGKLLPGMTANVDFIKQKKDDVLTVPSAAFRFTPTTMGAQEVKRAVFAAGLARLPEEQRQIALARYDEAQKAAAAGATDGAKTTGGLSSLMAGGMGGPGGGP